MSNRMGVSSSYNYVAKSEGNNVPVPNTFTRGAYICRAMDSGEFNDHSSI